MPANRFPCLMYDDTQNSANPSSRVSNKNILPLFGRRVPKRGIQEFSGAGIQKGEFL